MQSNVTGAGNLSGADTETGATPTTQWVTFDSVGPLCDHIPLCLSKPVAFGKTLVLSIAGQWLDFQLLSCLPSFNGLNEAAEIVIAYQ